MGDVRLICGDCLQEMATLRAASVHAIVTDPPASISFMGKAWDSDRGGRAQWTAWLTSVMAECLRCLKPGHYALVWAIPRRAHWTAIALEDAGFEIRDVIHHLFGSGFPKGKGCLKPACENWILCRKPGPKVLPLQIDACRISGTVQSGAGATGFGQRDDNYELGTGRQYQTAGRWPANVILSDDPEVIGMFPQTTSGSGIKCPAGSKIGNGITHRNRASRFDNPGIGGDSGSAARFFYCAKASKRDRDEGCEGLPEQVISITEGHGRGPVNTSKNGEGIRENRPRRNSHPTVKPTALMRYLCRLICPAGGTILDPFCGSGSTGKAARLEGFGFVGIEKEAEYHAIAQRRIAAAQAETPLFAEAK